MAAFDDSHADVADAALFCPSYDEYAFEVHDVEVSIAFWWQLCRRSADLVSAEHGVCQSEEALFIYYRVRLTPFSKPLSSYADQCEEARLRIELIKLLVPFAVKVTWMMVQIVLMLWFSWIMLAYSFGGI
jgi:hypothetical protein